MVLMFTLPHMAGTSPLGMSLEQVEIHRSPMQRHAHYGDTSS